MKPSFPVGDGKNTNRDRASTPSKSSSTSSYSSPETVKSSSARKAMEDMWKDMNLDSPRRNNEPTNTTNFHSFFPCMILQDFLPRPSRKDQTSAQVSVSSAEVTDDFINSMGSLPATLLSLNSGSDNFQLNSLGEASFRSSHVSPFEILGSSSASPSNIFKKRQQENQENSCDRRHKRMIKNRESAARSRARKQAYTQELELELKSLREENARLRRQQERLLADQVQVTKKNRLHRTSTAPF